MRTYNLSAIHDRIDEEHFEVRLHSAAIAALQQRVIELESAVRSINSQLFGSDLLPEARRAGSGAEPRRRARA